MKRSILEDMTLTKILKLARPLMERSESCASFIWHCGKNTSLGHYSCHECLNESNHKEQPDESRLWDTRQLTMYSSKLSIPWETKSWRYFFQIEEKKVINSMNDPWLDPEFPVPPKGEIWKWMYIVRSIVYNFSMHMNLLGILLKWGFWFSRSGVV